MGKDKPTGGGKRRGKNRKEIKPKFLKKRKQARLKFKSNFDATCRLVVKNLSFKTTEENIKQHFEPYGKVVDVKLLKKKNGDIVGTGFVQFANNEQAKQALHSRNDQPFLGRSIQIEWSIKNDESKQNKPKDTSDDIEIKSESDDDNEASKSTKSANKDADKQKILRKARIIVRNMSFKVTEESLKEHFKSYGEVLETVLLKKPSGELVGCGFIQFNNIKSATKAIMETNSKPFLGRPIFVDWAVAKNKYMSYVTQKEDEEKYLKYEVKSEPESDDDEKSDQKTGITDISIKTESGNESDHSDKSDDDASDKDSDSDSNNENDEEDKIDNDDEDKRVSANDAEDGLTIFFKNVPFGVTNDDLKEFATQFGEFNYALVCVDKLTEHSKGTAFVRFKNKEDADMCFSAGPEKLHLQGQQLQPLSAVFRDKSKGKSTGKKEPKDSRNLYLIKEGLILANSKSAFGVSASDMTKRLGLEQRKSDMLKNLNRFISRYRLTIHNIPERYNDEELRKLCLETTNVKPYALKECRIMRHMKGPFDETGKPMSKGFGFVMFTKHEFALTCLRRMNNNPNIFDKNNRPIVAFSIEDKSVINARKKRLQKSKLKNPTYIDKIEKRTAKSENTLGKTFKNKFENTNKNEGPNISAKYGRKLNKKPQSTIKMGDGMDDFVGEAGKPGAVSKMRSRYKLKMQANMHKDNLKQEKKQQKLSKNSKKISSAKTRIKQPRQKMNEGQRNMGKKVAEQKNEKNFSDMVNKYKSKLVNVSTEHKVKSKWYEQS